MYWPYGNRYTVAEKSKYASFAYSNYAIFLLKNPNIRTKSETMAALGNTRIEYYRFKK